MALNNNGEFAHPTAGTVAAPTIQTGDELSAGRYYTLYRNEQGVPNGDVWIASKYKVEGDKTLVVRMSDGGAFFATREDIFTIV